MAENVVGETGFEPATLCSQSQREERISGPEGVKPDTIPGKGIKGLPGSCKTTVGGRASADLSGLHVYVRTPGPHVRFTVDRTSYIRNLDHRGPEFREPWAVYYEAPPKRNANGSTTFSLIIPMLVVTGYLAEQKAIADRIAAILEKHWDDADV